MTEADPTAAFRDGPALVATTVCLPAGAPRSHAEATAIAVDLMAPWVVAFLLLLIVVHLWLPKAMPAAVSAGAFIRQKLMQPS